MKFFRCRLCLLPNTKPDLTFREDGLCAACVAYENRPTVNWAKRRYDFVQIMNETHGKHEYDCIIPVSGGKDSTAQVLRVLELGYKPLAVNARTCDLSELGRANLDNISNLGVDLLEVAPDMKLRKLLNKYALMEIGDISWPEHVLIFTVPTRIAVEKKIPVIVWGENPQNEYGGPLKDAESGLMNSGRWLAEFGGLNGLRVSDVQEAIEEYDSSYTASAFNWYTYPSAEQTQHIKQIFLGHYFSWTGLENARLAAQHGWQPSDYPVEGSGYHEENLDNHQTGVHDYFKALKFGFGRATDLVSSELRRGSISREDAIRHLEKWDCQYPATYLGKSLLEIRYDINLTLAEWKTTVSRFANPNLWDKTCFPPKLLYGARHG
jgi:N-acetyl sugar amidotransferase